MFGWNKVMQRRGRLPPALIGWFLYNLVCDWLAPAHRCSKGWPAVTWQFDDPVVCVLVHKNGDFVHQFSAILSLVCGYFVLLSWSIYYMIRYSIGTVAYLHAAPVACMFAFCKCSANGVF